LAKPNSASLQLAYASGLAIFAAGLALAWPSAVHEASAQESSTLCPASGFDVCFPELDAGAPNAACDASSEDAVDVTACLGNVCSGEASEPEPGFFSYCCAQGGSVRYDDFCVFVVQTACPAVADHCADRCPPLALLTGTVPLAPPPQACIATYPAFIDAVCKSDPFCCTTSWDEICAAAAVEFSGG
jgi:hypothetical protein